MSEKVNLAEAILNALTLEEDLSPKQIKVKAGLPLDRGINSVLKRLGKQGKVQVAYGKYRLKAQTEAAPVLPRSEQELAFERVSGNTLAEEHP